MDEAFVNGGSKEAYRAMCKSARREIRSIISCWWRKKATAIQEQVDNKEPHAVYAGQRELMDALSIAGGIPTNSGMQRGGL